MSRAVRSHSVIFFEEPLQVPAGPDLPRLVTRMTPEGVLVATPWVAPDQDEVVVESQQARLLDELVSALPTSVQVAWFYTPMALAFAASLHAEVTVFDSMDELSAFCGASPRLPLLERRLLRRADLVFAGGHSLHRAKSRLHPRVHLFPSSVDVPNFHRAREAIAEPLDQAGLPHPRLGFHGVVDERMDLGLLAAIADRRPAWQVVIVGPVAKLDPASLPQRRNLHWLGQKPYASLPSYLSGWDVGLMPFALNEATRYISPTKTPEFLAAGVPVVSTPVGDVVHDWGRDGLVEIASGADAMVRAVERLLTQPKQAWLTRVDQRLRRMSWDATWARMQSLMQDAAHTAQPGREEDHRRPDNKL
jgi:UDP-galactopyranose mutase